ncbi:hypothetical protein [Tsuneonella amylolytica]|uniref:hypothetical protein n=1 Tax=Tsuneonella amylolytica TaxID=2338327 RepID=UPI0013C48FE2|nr:hypothetical protein [Tsuneonella amylolytica]
MTARQIPLQDAHAAQTNGRAVKTGFTLKYARQDRVVLSHPVSISLPAADDERAAFGLVHDGGFRIPLSILDGLATKIAGPGGGPGGATWIANWGTT